MRPFSWLDLITLFRCRHQVLALDSVQLLTRGNPVGPTAMLAYLNPARGSYIGVSTLPKGDPVLIGQMCHNMGERSAHLLFLLPSDACLSPALSSLLEGLTKQAGEWGAFNLLAEVEEHTPAFVAFRNIGFTVFARQRIWQLPTSPEKPEVNGNRHWQPAVSKDEIAIRSLYNGVVPPLVQRAEPLEEHHPQVLVYRQEGEILAFVEAETGPNGIYIQPFVHPGVENVAELLSSLPLSFSPLLGRPIYLAIRSYQAWLEAALQETEARAAPNQALMVRYLTNVVTAPLAARLSVLETHGAKPTVPVVHNFLNDN